MSYTFCNKKKRMQKQFKNKQIKKPYKKKMQQQFKNKQIKKQTNQEEVWGNIASIWRLLMGQWE